jgi:hypothetical protein
MESAKGPTRLAAFGGPFILLPQSAAAITRLRECMASKGQFTGMTGAFLVAAQLSARRLVASTTSRSAAGADILVTDAECCVAFSVQVKTNSRSARGFWILGKKEPSRGNKSHVYAFVALDKDQSGDTTADFYLVPSAVVRKVARYGGRGWEKYSVYKEDILKYRNNWGIFGVE